MANRRFFYWCRSAFQARTNQPLYSRLQAVPANFPDTVGADRVRDDLFDRSNGENSTKKPAIIYSFVNAPGVPSNQANGEGEVLMKVLSGNFHNQGIAIQLEQNRQVLVMMLLSKFALVLLLGLVFIGVGLFA